MRYTPLENAKDKVRAWSVQNARGPYATPFLAVVSFAESVFFPIPVDIVLIPLLIIRARSWVYYTVIASAASVLGGVAGYAIGFFFFSLVGEYIVSFYGLETELAVVTAWLAENTFWATFISAFTPIPYKVFTLSAGLLQAPFLLFLLASILGRTLRYFLVGIVTHLWGAQIARLVLRHFTLATILVLAGALIAYILIRTIF